MWFLWKCKQRTTSRETSRRLGLKFNSAKWCQESAMLRSKMRPRKEKLADPPHPRLGLFSISGILDPVRNSQTLWPWANIHFSFFLFSCIIFQERRNSTKSLGREHKKVSLAPRAQKKLFLIHEMLFTLSDVVNPIRPSQLFIPRTVSRSSNCMSLYHRGLYSFQSVSLR